MKRILAIVPLLAAGLVAVPPGSGTAALPCAGVRPPCVYFADDNGNRGDEGKFVRVRVEASGPSPSGSPITVTYRTVHVTTNDADLVPVPHGQVTLDRPAALAAGGPPSGEIVVTLRDDRVCEHTELFRIELLATSAGTVVDRFFDVYLYDDDCPA